MIHVLAVPDGLSQVAAALAVSSLLIAGLGLLAARRARRSAPLSHGLLLCTLLVLLALPAAPFAAAFVDIDWLPRHQLFLPESEAIASTFGPAVGAAGSASAQSGAANNPLTTLSADDIPAGAVLPGSGSATSGSPVARYATGGSLRSTPSTPKPGWHNSRLLASAVLALWLAGSVISLIRTLRSSVAVARIVRRAAPVSDASSLELLAELAIQLGLRRPPRLRTTARVRIPFAWGLMRPAIVLPQRMVAGDDVAGLRPILLHELAHVRRRDVWIGVVQRIVAAMYWWNPLVHAVNLRLADAREQICDAHVLAGGCASRDYAELLVDLASQVALPHPAAALGLLSRSQPQLTRRVQHLLEDQPMSTSLRRIAKVFLMGVFVLLSTAAIVTAYILVDESDLFAQRYPPSVLPGQPLVAWHPAQPATVTNVQPAQQRFVDADSFSADAAAMAAEEPALAFSPPGDENPFGAPASQVDLFAADEAAPAASRRRAASADQEDFQFTEAAEDEAGFGASVQPGGGPGSAGFVRGGGGGRGARGGFGMGVGGGKGFADMQFSETDSQSKFAGPRLHGLALIGLAAAEDGSLRNLYWFTQPLGAGDEAYAKLGERLSEFAGRFSQPMGDSSTTTRQMFGARGGFAAPGGRRSRDDDEFDTAFVGGHGGPGFGAIPGGGVAATATGRATRVGGGMGMMPGASGMFGMAATGGQAPITHLAAQISASPEIKYGVLKRVIELCEQHVDQIFFGDDSQLKPDITLTLGFVRDGGGSKISSSPVLIWNYLPSSMTMHALSSSTRRGGFDEDSADEFGAREQASPVSDQIVTVGDLPHRLLQWRQTLPEDIQSQGLTALIRPDVGIDAKLVEEVVQATLPAGVERVDIRWLAPPVLQDEPTTHFLPAQESEFKEESESFREPLSPLPDKTHDSEI